MYTIDFSGTKPVRIRQVQPGEKAHPIYHSKADAQWAFDALKNDDRSRKRRGCRGRSLLY